MICIHMYTKLKNDMCESLLDSYELPLKDVGLHTCTVAIGIFLRTTCPQRDFQNISESIVVHMISCSLLCLYTVWTHFRHVYHRS